MDLGKSAYTLDTRLYHAFRAAENCSDIMLHYYDKPYRISFKAPGVDSSAYRNIEDDPSAIKLPMDRFCDQICREYLNLLYPEFGFVGEESFDPEDLSEFKDVFWCVDPICGSKGYFEKNDHFGTSVALIEKGKGVILGAMNCPRIGLKGIAHLSSGTTAYSGHVRRPAKGLCVLISSNVRRSEKFNIYQQIVRRLNADFVGYETSIPTKSLKVLTGVYDLHFSIPAHIVGGGGPKIWDLAASDCFFRAEKYRLTDFYGNRLDFSGEFKNNDTNGHRYKNGYIMARDNELWEKCINALKAVV